MKRTQKFIIDGKTYDSLDEMPASVRKKWETLSALLLMVTADATANPSKTTTVRFEEHIEYGPSEHDRGAGTASDLLLNKLVDTLQANARFQLSAGIQSSPEEITVRVQATGTTKMAGLALVALLFGVLGLAMFGIFTRVRIMMIYGPAWWAGAAGVAIGLTAGLAWGWNRRQVPTLTNPEPKRMGLRELIPLLIGMTCISLEGILGGLPALAHHLTSQPGEAIVTVAAKENTSQRYSCNPRLIISEFTYGLKNYLCPSDRAFGQIQVGATVRVEGTVSAFGVEPRYISWPDKIVGGKK